MARQVPENVRVMMDHLEDRVLEYCRLTPLSRLEILDCLTTVARCIIDDDLPYSGDSYID